MPTPSTIRTISPATRQDITLTNFDAIRLRLASPEDILSWSHGEIVKPETINYRTQKPERDGLFCERIFGPVKDWECACGKYKKIRYKGITCDKCGVEVTRSMVRRTRMGHIELAAPVSHIWFLRGIPSRIGLILDISIQGLEKVIYFASFIITKVEEELKGEILGQMDKEYKAKKKAIDDEYNREKSKLSGQTSKKDLENLSKEREKKMKDLKEAVNVAKKELEEIKVNRVISKNSYEELALKYGHIFEAKIGAEAIRELLSSIDLPKEKEKLEAEIAKNKGNAGAQRKTVRRLKLIKNFFKNKTRPEWMILTVLPVIPADLRPMVQLDGGRFASSDLNDLYRRVINRNNRLKRLLELNAPEVICCNEKRMLQEAVDALIDNSARHGKTVTASTGQKRTLKSIADILKGKQGRFRQNLLGKRVDYSGRSVIVVGPRLKLHQCGLPKIMAIELFKPFVISELIKRGIVHNVRSGSRLIEEKKSKEVWDILEEITQKSYVLLNRAPTLHRLSVQAFQPVLIEGKAIQIHPLVCPPFNADFDGDQMAVHVPLTSEAMNEAKERMLSSRNLLKPATGEPVVTPAKDMILGCYLLSFVRENKPDEKMKIFSSVDEVLLAYHSEKIDINKKIKVRLGDQLIETGVGRVILNSIFPEKLRNYDKLIDNKALREIVSHNYELFGAEETARLLDDIKTISLEYLTKIAPTWSMDDLPDLPEKKELIEGAEDRVQEIQGQYDMGLLTESEKHGMIVENWQGITSKITEISQKAFSPDNPIYSMIVSGARGSWGQMVQMMGMKGLVANPAGETIELPIKRSFKEGVDVLEYFISTHGGRKGMADTALRTATAGYLTRRLVDISHDVIITEEDCGDDEGLIIDRKESEEIGSYLANRIFGRVIAETIINPQTKKEVIKKGELITFEKAQQIGKLPIEQVKVRSVLSCKVKRGVCKKCYGYDLGYNKLVETGEAVGVVAAQSIGEPGTQLTMRTFHTGGVAGKHDITQGLPRVQELFEVRSVKNKAIIAEEEGNVQIVKEKDKQMKIIIEYKSNKEDKYELKHKKAVELKIKVKDGEGVKRGDSLFKKGDEEIKAEHGGQVVIKKDLLKVVYEGKGKKEYVIPSNYTIWVKDGDLVVPGDQLTDGNLDIQELYDYKGKKEAQKYLVREVLRLYLFAGQKVHDKHVEVIVRQMFSRVYVKDAQETDLLSGEVVPKSVFEEVNEKAITEGKKPAIGEDLLLGITKVALSTESFLSAASFQETARVLIDAAITEKTDKLKGLKENVIIGHLIPAGSGYGR